MQRFNDISWFDKYVEDLAEMLGKVSSWGHSCILPGLEPDPDTSLPPFNDISLSQVVAMNTISLREPCHNEDDNGPAVWIALILGRTAMRVFVMMESNPEQSEVCFDWREIRTAKEIVNYFSAYDIEALACVIVNMSSEWLETSFECVGDDAALD